MAFARSVDLLAFAFDAESSLPAEVAQHLDRLRGRGLLRILDVLVVSKDSHGTFRAIRDVADRDTDAAVSIPSTLWQLLVDGSPESGTVTDGLLGQLRSWEAGIDLDTIERLEMFIEPDTSALLMLVQAKWATDLLDIVVRSGGYPLVFGCLERETMLVIGPDLAAASDAARAVEHTAARHGAAMLEALATAAPVATEVIAALLDADLLDESEVDDAVGVLAAVGLVSARAFARARENTDARLVDSTFRPLWSVDPKG